MLYEEIQNRSGVNDLDTTPLPYVCISPELGKFMNVCLILKADVQIQLEISSNSQTDPVFVKVIPVKTFAIFQITADTIITKISNTHSH